MARTDTINSAPMTAFLMGSLLGVTAGLLFAPKTGRESRDILKQTARDNLAKMKEKARQKREIAAPAPGQTTPVMHDIVEFKEDIGADTSSFLDNAKPDKHAAL